MNKSKIYQIFTFVFAFLFLVMLIINIYQRQFIYTGEEISDLYETPNETIILDKDDTIPKDYIIVHSFLLYEDSYIDLEFSSDTLSNIYLFDDAEYLRYDEGEQSYYKERGLNTNQFSLTSMFLQAGEYYIVIESIDEIVNYHIKLVAAE